MLSGPPQKPNFPFRGVDPYDVSKDPNLRFSVLFPGSSSQEVPFAQPKETLKNIRFILNTCNKPGDPAYEVAVGVPVSSIDRPLLFDREIRCDGTSLVSDFEIPLYTDKQATIRLAVAKIVGEYLAPQLRLDFSIGSDMNDILIGLRVSPNGAFSTTFGYSLNSHRYTYLR